MSVATLSVIQIEPKMVNNTCITTTEGANEILNDMNLYILLLQGTAVMVLEVLGAVMNIFVMIVILANKELYTRPFMISLQIIILNLLTILFLFTPISITGLYREWIFGETFCIAVGAITLFLTTWRWPVMFLLILDRFLTVSYPFRYRAMAKYLITIFSVMSLIISILIAVIPLLDIGAGCYSFIGIGLSCSIAWQCTSIICYAYYFTVVMVVFFLGGIAPIIMYAAMFIKGKRMRKALMSGSPVINVETVPQNSIVGKSSEKRAGKTVLVMFITLFCLTVPFLISALVLQSIATQASISNITVNIVVAVQFVLNDIYYCLPIADNVVILKNKDIQQAVKKLAMKKPKNFKIICLA